MVGGGVVSAVCDGGRVGCDAMRQTDANMRHAIALRPLRMRPMRQRVHDDDDTTQLPRLPIPGYCVSPIPRFWRPCIAALHFFGIICVVYDSNGNGNWIIE